MATENTTKKTSAKASAKAAAPKAAVAPKAKKAAGATRTITIRMVKGTIACPPKQRACINGLGLKRREQEVTLENTPSVRGMIRKVLHLVEIVAESR